MPQKILESCKHVVLMLL